MSAAPHPRFGPLDFAIVAVMNLMWGLNIIAAKMGVELAGPMTAAFLRQVIVFLVCLPMLRIVPGRMRELIALGLLSGAAFYIAINLSLALADNVSALAIAGQLGVPFSLILAVLFLGERIRAVRLFGIGLAFSGVVLLVFDPEAGKEAPGLLMQALASLLWAMSSLIQRRMSGVPVLTIYAWMGLIGAVILLPVAWVVEPQRLLATPALPLATLGWIAFSAIGSTIIGHGSMSWLLQRHPISTVVPFTLAAPVISIIVASLYFETPLTPLMIAGGLIALAGVAIIAVRTARAGEGQNQPQ
jgi:O-acetylserine/cysteine efflux transporter